MVEPIPGYLSLHHTIETLTLKWTPNQLMNCGTSDFDGIDKRYVDLVYMFSIVLSNR